MNALKYSLMISAGLCCVDDGGDNIGGAGGFAPMPKTNNSVSATTTENRADGVFAEVDGQQFKTPEELSAYVAQKSGDTTHPDYKPPETKADEEKPAAEETPKEGLKDPEAKSPEEKAAETKDAKPTWIQPDITDEALKENLTKAGGFYTEEDYFPLAAEFERTGTVSEDNLKTYAEKKSLPLDMVKEFVAGQQSRRELATERAASTAAQQEAAVQATVQKVYGVVGGEDQYKALSAWAAVEGNLTTTEMDAYGRALDNDPETAIVLLQGFNAKFKAAGNGKPARDITEGQGNGGDGPKAAADQGYASKAEQQKDIGSEQYRTDPAFRAQVMRRIAATTAF